MIIDELLDRINDKRLLNIEYIKKQSMQFEFEYILKPILNQVNTDNILQEFYNDIKKCFECVGV